MSLAMRSKRQTARPVSRGASRHVEAHGPSAVGRFFVKLLLLIKCVSLLGMLAGAGFATYTYAGQWMERPVANVSIKGSFDFASKQQLADEVYQLLNKSFMRLDLEKMQVQLEESEWIASVQVGRRWPDVLEVVVVEHRPIARWGDDKALNQRGELINIKNYPLVAEKLQSLPRLNGPKGLEKSVMLQFESAMQLLSQHGLEITGLKTNASRSWVLTLNGGVEVKVGRHEFMEKLDRFLIVYERQLKQRWFELESADLRYFNGVAVRWNHRKMVKSNA